MIIRRAREVPDIVLIITPSYELGFRRFNSSRVQNEKIYNHAKDVAVTASHVIGDAVTKIMVLLRYPFDYSFTTGFGSIIGGLDHVNPVIRLPIKHGISRGTRVGLSTSDQHWMNPRFFALLCNIAQENVGYKAPGVIKPEIGGNVNFEIKSQFMRELREDTFFGNKNEDAHDHTDRVLNIVSLFNILGISKDTVLLHVFPFTLTGSAKRWVDRLTPGAVNTTISSSSNTDGLAAVISKLDNLGRYMKKLKENFHAIQVGCQICEGPHLDKECPLNEEVKQVEEVKAYYTRIDNRPPYREKGPSLEVLMNKYQEESAQRNAKMGEWIKKLQENAKINTRNQSASLKNLETKIEQLTKELHSRTINEAHSLSTGKCKVVNADHETPNIPISSSKLNNLHKISFLSNSEVAQNKEERTIEVLQCQFPPKELNPGNFTLPCTIGNFNFYGMADLGASLNIMPRNIFEYLRLANLRNTNMLVEMADMTKKVPLVRRFLATPCGAYNPVFNKEISLSYGNDKIIFDMEKKDHNFMIPAAKILMTSNNEPSCPPGNPSLKSLKTDNLQDRQEQQVKKKLRLDENIPVKHFCKPIMQTYNGKVRMWPICDPGKSICDEGVEIYERSRVGNLRI
ncbi:hypothetical protein Tco_1211466 [Tanacetum coccineum]